jgi:predicted RNase H-like nuclease (RuvC/YqgF family)
MATKQELESEVIEKDRFIKDLQAIISKLPEGTTATLVAPDGKLEALQLEYNKLLDISKSIQNEANSLKKTVDSLNVQTQKDKLKIDELEQNINSLKTTKVASIGESITAIEVKRLVHSRSMDEGQILFIKKD